VIEAGQRLIPVEVKYKHLKQDKVPAPLRRFIDKYNPEQAYIINLDLSKTLKVMTTGGAGGLITPYKGIVTDTP